MDKLSRTRRERESCDRQVAVALRVWATMSRDEARVGEAAAMAAKHGVSLAAGTGGAGEKAEDGRPARGESGGAPKTN
jgi:hypothetical protein